MMNAGVYILSKILFVCTGNTCRSCMAEGIMKTLLKKAEDEVPRREFNVESRGIFAVDGDGASEKSIAVMNSLYGIDISSHKAKRLTKDDVLDSYLILTMTEDHKHAILLNWPEAKNKTFTLKEYAETNPDPDIKSAGLSVVFKNDIQDPYGGSISDYENCAVEINEAVIRVINKLINKANNDKTDKEND